MESIEEEQEIAAMALVRDLSAYLMYGSEMEYDGDDATEALNALIERARGIVGMARE